MQTKIEFFIDTVTCATSEELASAVAQMIHTAPFPFRKPTAVHAVQREGKRVHTCVAATDGYWINMQGIERRRVDTPLSE